jgi:hypothetical protein
MEGHVNLFSLLPEAEILKRSNAELLRKRKLANFNSLKKPTQHFTYDRLPGAAVA